MLHPLLLLLLIGAWSLFFSDDTKDFSTQPTISWVELTDEESTGVAISPDGNQIIYSNLDTGVIAVVHWRTQEILWQIRGGARQAQWSPDGGTIALLGSDIYVVDAATGQHFQQVERTFRDTKNALRLASRSENTGYSDLHWSPDSSRLAAMVYGYIVIYDFSRDVVSALIDVVMVDIDRNPISWFDWSPDGSTFVAFHYAIKDSEAGFPLSIVLGFWDSEGRWLRQYEQPEDTPQTCLPRSTDLFRGVEPIGSDLTWAEDNRTVAVSAGVVTICSLGSDGTLSMKEVLDAPPTAAQLYWTEDQAWLIGVRYDCTLLFADAANDYRPYLLSPDIFDSNNCNFRSAAWSTDGPYIVLGTGNGLWVGTIKLP